MLIVWTVCLFFLHTIACLPTESETLYCPLNCKCTSNSLECKHSELFYVPDFSMISHTIKSISLANNELEMISMSDFISGHLLNLENLDLSSNIVHFVEETSFTGLYSLKHLNLSHNLLETLPERLIEKNEQLETLRLVGNLFSVRAPVLISSSLKELYLSDCKIAHFNETNVVGLPNLRRLDLSANRLTHIHLVVFENTKLVRVDLAFNQWRCNCESIKIFHYITKRNITLDKSLSCLHASGHFEQLDYHSSHARFCIDGSSNQEEYQQHHHNHHHRSHSQTLDKHQDGDDKTKKLDVLQDETKKIELNAQFCIAIGVILVVTIATTVLVTWVCVVNKMNVRHKRDISQRNIFYRELHR